MKYEYNVYVSRHCHDILASYFENLSLQIAEDHLCGFEKDYYTYRYTLNIIAHKSLSYISAIFIQQLFASWYLNFREKQYKDTVQRIVKLIQDTAGIGVEIKKSPLGQFVIPQEISRKNPVFQE